MVPITRKALQQPLVELQLQWQVIVTTTTKVLVIVTLLPVALLPQAQVTKYC